MSKVLVISFSSSGKTETMANFIAEGIRFTGNTAVLKKLNDVNSIEQLSDYNGIIIGSPTFSMDIPEPVKKFLEKLKTGSFQGKSGGAFGPYLHDEAYRHNEHAPALILEFFQNELKMNPVTLGALSLKEDLIETRDGMKACQDYGRKFGQELSDK